MSYHSERNFHIDRIISAANTARRGFLNCSGLEDEHNVIKALTETVIREICDLTETCSGEVVWGFDAQHEGVLDNVKVAFDEAMDKREDCASPESRSAAMADMRADA